MSDDRQATTDEPIPPAIAAGPESSGSTTPREARPIIERIGLAAVAFAAAAMFGGVGYAAWLGGELFLAIIGGISCVMTAWVGMLTLVRG
jgi:hypothetical protein